MSEILQKRGRPRKYIDTEVIFHMIKNNSTIVSVAKHIGVHRDTIYTNFPSLIKDARAKYYEYLERRGKEKLQEILERLRLKSSKTKN